MEKKYSKQDMAEREQIHINNQILIKKLLNTNHQTSDQIIIQIAKESHHRMTQEEFTKAKETCLSLISKNNQLLISGSLNEINKNLFEINHLLALMKGDEQLVDYNSKLIRKNVTFLQRNELVPEIKINIETVHINAKSILEIGSGNFIEPLKAVRFFKPLDQNFIFENNIIYPNVEIHSDGLMRFLISKERYFVKIYFVLHIMEQLKKKRNDRLEIKYRYLYEKTDKSLRQFLNSQISKNSKEIKIDSKTPNLKEYLGRFNLSFNLKQICFVPCSLADYFPEFF